MPVPTRVIPRNVEYPQVKVNLNLRKCMPCLPGESPLELLDKRMLLGAVATISALSAIFNSVCDSMDPLHTFFVGSVLVYFAYYALDHVLLRYVPRYQVRLERPSQLAFPVRGCLLASAVCAEYT